MGGEFLDVFKAITDFQWEVVLWNWAVNEVQAKIRLIMISIVEQAQEHYGFLFCV